MTLNAESTQQPQSCCLSQYDPMLQITYKLLLIHSVVVAAAVVNPRVNSLSPTVYTTDAFLPH